MDKIPERLKPLANVASDLKDEDLTEAILFAAFLKYRRRVFKIAHDRAAELSRMVETAYCTCSTAIVHDGVCINCALPYTSQSVNR